MNTSANTKIWFHPDQPIAAGVRVAAASGWDADNKEHPLRRGTVIRRKQELEVWVWVVFDGEPETCVPCYALTKIDT